MVYIVPIPDGSNRQRLNQLRRVDVLSSTVPGPPTTNLDNQDPDCELHYVPNKPQKINTDYALSNSFGFGGTNGSLIFKRWTEQSS